MQLLMLLLQWAPHHNIVMTESFKSPVRTAVTNPSDLQPQRLMACWKVARLFVCAVVSGNKGQRVSSSNNGKCEAWQRRETQLPSISATATEKGATHTHTHPWVATGIITHLFRGRATPTVWEVCENGMEWSKTCLCSAWPAHLGPLNTIYNADRNPWKQFCLYKNAALVPLVSTFPPHVATNVAWAAQYNTTQWWLSCNQGEPK